MSFGPCDMPGCGKPSWGYSRKILPDGSKARIYFCEGHAPPPEVAAQHLFHYLQCRKEGTAHSLALMFATAQPPMSNTDREFLEGHCSGSQFADNPDQGDAYRSVATAAGQDTTGKVYLSGLAAYPGDPRAWVGGRGDVARVCEERGWNCSGSVNVQAAERGAPAAPPGGVADDILENEVEAVLATSERPELEDRGGIKEAIRQKRKPHWTK